ncbi:MAG: TolC family protein [Acidobacteriia bacterium]|nr:TolC family protein [Terriglobia bacterium]
MAQLNEPPSTGSTPSSGAPNRVGAQSPFLGSVPSGKATGAAIPLSIRDALERGLKYNLGLIESDLSARSSRAERLRALSHLLPNINASLSQTVEQIDLKAMGINFPGVPTTVGPFGVQDARGFLSQKVFDWNAVEELRASTERLKASQYTYKNSRDIVVLAVGNAYLLVVSDAASVESQQAQLNTSQALYQRAIDRREAGLAARINEMRAKVEMQTQQQRLIASQNQLAKDKLSLGRIIGLPPGQEFTLADKVPYAPLEGVTLEKALEDAYANRSDYSSAEAEVRAAELARRGAAAERYPSISTNLNYGDIGPNFANSHGTFTFAATLNVPIFQGGRVKADELQADTVLRQKQAELGDLRGRIDDEVRSAFLDLNSAHDLVNVSKNNLELANETLAQAKDRFAAGVTDNLEVVQAQESVAAANQAYISSLYSFNIAKVELAKAAGIAERAVKNYLGGK